MKHMLSNTILVMPKKQSAIIDDYHTINTVTSIGLLPRL